MTERKFKVIIAGEPGAGKNLIAEAADLCYPFKHYGVSIGKKTKIVKPIECNIVLMLWTLTTGRPKETTYLFGTDAAIIVSNLHDGKTVEKMPQWADSIREHVGDVPLVFVGNGIEEENEENAMRVKEIADTYDSLFLFTQWQDKSSVEEVFTEVAEILGYLALFNEILQSDRIRLR